MRRPQDNQTLRPCCRIHADIIERPFKTRSCATSRVVTEESYAHTSTGSHLLALERLGLSTEVGGSRSGTVEEAGEEWLEERVEDNGRTADGPWSQNLDRHMKDQKSLLTWSGEGPSRE